MPFHQELKTDIGRFAKRSEKAVGNLIEKSKLRIPQIKIPTLRETTTQAARGIRGFGRRVAEFGQDLTPTPEEIRTKPVRSLIGQSVARPLSFGGETVRGLGALSERALQPSETLKVARNLKRPTLEDPFGTFEEPTSIGFAADILGPGLDVTDIGRFGLIGLIGAGTRETTERTVKSRKTITEGAEALEDIAEGFRRGRKARLGDLEEGASFLQRTRAQFLDRLTPIFDLERKAPKELPAAKSPYKTMRLLAGVGGEIKSVVEQEFINPILRPVAQRGMLDDLSQLLVLERNREIAERGLKTRYTKEAVEEGIDLLRQKHGAEFEVLQESANQVRQYGNTLLDRLRDAGIIDDASYSAIRNKNEFYVPFRVVDRIASLAEDNKFQGTSFNVAQQNVIKELKGSQLQVGDPLEALIERTGKVLSLTKRNEALQNLVNLRKQDDVFEGLIKKAKGSAPEGFDTINLFENGKNVKYQVPEDIASAVKNLDAQTHNILTSVLVPQANLLRLGATGLNIGFIPVNIIRDLQDAFFSAFSRGGVEEVGQLIASYPAAISAALRQDDLYQQWLRSGAAQSTFISQILRSSPETIKELKGQKSMVSRAFKTVPDAIKWLNRVGEESTRVARFKSGLEAGEEVAEAAFASRDITLDFAKSGNVVRYLNTWIPFLNAGIQGTEKMFRIFKNNPKKAIVGASALGATPALGLHLWNRQFQDWRDIPRWEKDLNWIILARDRTDAERASGEPARGIKIPKPFFVRPIANGTESFLEFAENNDPDALTQFAYNTAEEVSPVGIPLTGRFLSSTLPPLAQAAIEWQTNKSLFTGFPIVPRRLEDVEPEEQFREDTPLAFRALGNLGISPLKAEQAVRTTTGRVGTQLAKILSGEPGSATAGEISRRFLDIRTGGEVDELFDEVQDIARTSKTESLKEKREAEKLYAELKNLPREEAANRFDELLENNPDMADEINDIVEEERLGLSAIDRSVKALPVHDGSRAKFVFQRLNELETNEQKAQLWDEYTNKKILTSDIANQVRFLLNQQKQESAKSLENERQSFIQDRPDGVDEDLAGRLFDEAVETIAAMNIFNPPEAQAAELTDVILGERTTIVGPGMEPETKVERTPLKEYLKEKLGGLIESVRGLFGDDEGVEETRARTREEKTGPGFTEPMLQPGSPGVPLPGEREPTQTPIPTKTEKQLRVSLPAYYEDKNSNQIIVRGSGVGDKPTTTKVPENISETLVDVFGEDLALEAARVLHHPMQITAIPGEQERGVNTGPNRGENPEFDVEKDAFNYVENDPDRGIKQVYNPFTDSNVNSVDRGLFRIHNGTFFNYLNGRELRPRMKEMGIIETDDLSKLDWEKAWEGMKDPIKNIKMAKLIYENQGWGAWFAAPTELRLK